MNKAREEFKLYKNKDGDFVREQDKDNTLEEIVFAVKKPNHEQQREADFVWSKYMNDYILRGIMPQRKLSETLRENKIWGEKEDNEEKELVAIVHNAEAKRKKGGIKQSEMAQLAKDSIKARFDLMKLSAKRSEYLNNSAETLSQNHKFNFLVSQCTVYSNTDKPVFKDYDDFLKQDNQGSLLPFVAGEVFSKLLYGFDEDFRKDWPEYKFLLKYKFVNDKLELVDKEGNLIDVDGKKIDKTQEVPVETEVEPEFLPD